MVETDATGRPFPGFGNIKEDIIADIDDTYDLGSDDKRWAYIFAVIAILTSIVIGGVVSISTLDSWLFINASTMINGSLNISENLDVDGNVTADYYYGNGSQLTGVSFLDGNLSWNQSLADSLYAGIQWGYNQTTATYNLYNLIWTSTYNATYAGSVNNASYLSTFNTTYDAKITDNASWNESHANTLYADISVTGDNESWNQSLADSLYADISVTGDNASWNESYADTLYADISVTGDNESWNQSGANLLYANISWNYNQTIPANTYTTNTNSSLAVWIIAQFVKISDVVSYVGNWSADKVNYLTNTEINNTIRIEGLLLGFNRTDNATYDAKVSFPGWADNLTWTNETNKFTENQNVTNHNITDIDCFIFDSGGKICSGV